MKTHGIPAEMTPGLNADKIAAVKILSMEEMV
jgi:hypothetical protein